MDLTRCSSFKARLLYPRGNPFENDRIYGIGAVLVGHRCYIFGGYSEVEVKLYIFDTSSNSWASSAVLNSKTVCGQVRVHFMVADILFAFVLGNNSHVYELVTLDLLEPSEWRSVDSTKPPAFPPGVSGCFVERRGETLVTYQKDRTLRTGVEVLRIDSHSWYTPTIKGTPPLLERNHCSCAIGYQVFAMGQYHEVDHLCLSILDVTALPFVWSTPIGGTYFPRKRFLFQASCTVNRIFLYGGFDGEASFDVFSIKDEKWLSSVPFKTNWSAGTSENAVVQTSNKLIVFGGFQLPARNPLEISPG